MSVIHSYIIYHLIKDKEVGRKTYLYLPLKNTPSKPYCKFLKMVVLVLIFIVISDGIFVHLPFLHHFSTVLKMVLFGIHLI